VFLVIDDSYVLITSAHNEEAYIGRTIRSVMNQTKPPRKWLIVNDSSTDGTIAVVKELAAKCGFIRLLDHTRENATHDFASRVSAINHAYERLGGINYDYIGILDSDISLPTDYYERLLHKFRANRKLGIAAGNILQLRNGRFEPRQNNRGYQPAGAVQLFARGCYERIGGLQPFCGGYDDTIAAIKARMHGWETQTFFDIPVQHHRPTGTTGRSGLAAKFTDGRTEYSIGYHPLYELANCLIRTTEKPYLAGAAIKLLGYWYGHLQERMGHVPGEFVEYLRTEQMERLRSAFRCLVRSPADARNVVRDDSGAAETWRS
jgi:glycosyltransferase involved in cell wall biosynthesis